MTTRLRYDGPGHLLVIDDTTTIARGHAAVVKDAMAEMLLDCGYADVTVIPPGAEQWPTSHTKLDTIAARFGVTFPTPFEGEKKLPVPEKVAALEAAGLTPDTVFEVSDAPDTDPEPETAPDTEPKEK